MAKGNLFLGTAARSVGDVVMYRREGSQVSRVRVRKIANPKTDAQCEQRAFMAAVVKFYQPLANVLDRSWQGLSRAKSYAKFLKVNVAKVREAGYYLKKDTGFFPLPLQLSNGTIASIGYEISLDDASLVTGLVVSDNAPTTLSDLSSIFVDSGYKQGDIVTIILAHGNSIAGFISESFQFEVNTSATETLADVFGGKITFVKNSDNNTLDIGYGSYIPVAGAIIVARNVDGVWQRSKQKMAVDASTLTSITSAEAKAAAIASYKGAAASDNPLVYLDGDELQ